MKPKRSTGVFEPIRPMTPSHVRAELDARNKERERIEHLPEIDLEHLPPFPGETTDIQQEQPSLHSETRHKPPQRNQESDHSSNENPSARIKQLMTRATKVQERIQTLFDSESRYHPADAKELYQESLATIKHLITELQKNPTDPALHKELADVEKKYPPASRYRDAG